MSMRTLTRILAPSISALCLVACDGSAMSTDGDGDSTDAATSSLAEAPLADAVATLLPTPPLSDFALGTAVNPQGVVHASDHAERFVAGMAVHYSMRVDAAQPESRVKVVWGAHQEAVSQSEEQVVGEHATLSFVADTTDWPAGHYTVQTWIGDEMLDERIFEVVES